MRGGADLDAEVRSASDRADGDAICALIRCADLASKAGCRRRRSTMPCEGLRAATSGRAVVEAVTNRG